MKLVVGLGNPGKEYENTRHNIGFMALDHYLLDESFKQKENYLILEKMIDGEKVLFLKPLTFMNESGIAVRRVVDFYHIDIKDVLVIYDDMDFEVGSYKLKLSGSSAGHNGIKSIISHLGTEDFNRLRIGISKSDGDTINYVLGKFSKEDYAKICDVFNISDKIIEDFASMEFDKIMSKYN